VFVQLTTTRCDVAGVDGSHNTRRREECKDAEQSARGEIRSRHVTTLPMSTQPWLDFLFKLSFLATMARLYPRCNCSEHRGSADKDPDHP
jgi:hypothetical protein